MPTERLCTVMAAQGGRCFVNLGDTMFQPPFTWVDSAELLPANDVAFIVRSSWGQLFVSADGVVLGYWGEDKVGAVEAFGDIARFDIAEFNTHYHATAKAGDEFDILDLRMTLKDGTVIDADPTHRELVPVSGLILG
jgi:hypothetical protein